jgi:hypothetical protein
VQISKDGIHSRPTVSRPSSSTGKVIGNAKSGLIKAAAPNGSAPEKSVFGIYNVGDGYDVEDIRKQCKKQNFKVLFCFNVTKSDQTSRTFKLAVDKKHDATILLKSSWPAGIEIRRWKYKSATAEVEQLNLTDSRDSIGTRVGQDIINNRAAIRAGPQLSDFTSSLVAANSSNSYNSAIIRAIADIHATTIENEELSAAAQSTDNDCRMVNENDSTTHSNITAAAGSSSTADSNVIAAVESDCTADINITVAVEPSSHATVCKVLERSETLNNNGQ